MPAKSQSKRPAKAKSAKPRIVFAKPETQEKRWPPPTATSEIDIHSICGANINGEEFYRQLMALDQPTRDKIIGVASRLQLVNALQRETAFSANWSRIQSDALTVYLLCTCLDALAGQPSYQQFRDWIVRGEQQQLLENTLTEFDLGIRPLPDWYKQVTQKLGSTWLDTYGVSRNFRRLISDLPEPLRKELVNSYAIIREPAERLESWRTLTEEERLKRVTSYLYNLRRNTFTHQARIVPTIVPVHGITGTVCAIPAGMWDYAVYFTNTDEVRGEISLLRIVIIGAIRQLVRYPVDQEFVDLHWRVERMNKLLWRALSEIRYNEELRYGFLAKWPVNLAVAPKYMRPRRFVYKSLQYLATGKEVDFSWYYPLTKPEDREIRNDIRSYIAEIRRFNGLIEKFEQLALKPKVWDKTKIAAYKNIREAMRDGRWTELAERLDGGFYLALEGAPENITGPQT